MLGWWGAKLGDVSRCFTSSFELFNWGANLLKRKFSLVMIFCVAIVCLIFSLWWWRQIRFGVEFCRIIQWFLWLSVGSAVQDRWHEAIVCWMLSQHTTVYFYISLAKRRWQRALGAKRNVQQPPEQIVIFFSNFIQLLISSKSVCFLFCLFRWFDQSVRILNFINFTFLMLDWFQPLLMQ